jgi:hypothetical protein
MDGQAPLHFAGDVLATTAVQIATALRSLPDSELRVTDEVEVDGQGYSFSVYPTGHAPEGGSDFLVGGNCWMNVNDAREVLRLIATQLDRAELLYQLELSVDGKDERTAHPRYQLFLDARVEQTTK